MPMSLLVILDFTFSLEERNVEHFQHYPPPHPREKECASHNQFFVTWPGSPKISYAESSAKIFLTQLKFKHKSLRLFIREEKKKEIKYLQEC